MVLNFISLRGRSSTVEVVEELQYGEQQGLHSKYIASFVFLNLDLDQVIS